MWDLSGLEKEKLRTPQKLEIGWFLGETAPERGPRGKQHAGSNIGTVHLDTIRMTRDIDLANRVALSNQMSNLLAEHGDYIYRSSEFFEGGERGFLEFADGTEIEVTWEELAEEKERYEVDGVTYRLGGGW